MKSLNQVLLIGEIVSNPEIKSSKNGTQFLKFTLKTYKTVKLREETRTFNEFHKIICWHPDIIKRKIKINQQATVIGEIKTRSYIERDEKKYITEIVCDILLNSLEPIDLVSNNSNQFDFHDDDLPF